MDGNRHSRVLVKSKLTERKSSISDSKKPNTMKVNGTTVQLRDAKGRRGQQRISKMHYSANSQRSFLEGQFPPNLGPYRTRHDPTPSSPLLRSKHASSPNDLLLSQDQALETSSKLTQPHCAQDTTAGSGLIEGAQNYYSVISTSSSSNSQPHLWVPFRRSSLDVYGHGLNRFPPRVRILQTSDQDPLSSGPSAVSFDPTIVQSRPNSSGSETLSGSARRRPPPYSCVRMLTSSENSLDLSLTTLGNDVQDLGIQTPEQYSVSAPVSASVSAPVSASVSAPVSASVPASVLAPAPVLAPVPAGEGLKKLGARCSAKNRQVPLGPKGGAAKESGYSRPSGVVIERFSTDELQRIIPSGQLEQDRLRRLKCKGNGVKLPEFDQRYNEHLMQRFLQDTVKYNTFKVEGKFELNDFESTLLKSLENSKIRQMKVRTSKKIDIDEEREFLEASRDRPLYNSLLLKYDGMLSSKIKRASKSAMDGLSDLYAILVSCFNVNKFVNIAKEDLLNLSKPVVKVKKVNQRDHEYIKHMNKFDMAWGMMDNIMRQGEGYYTREQFVKHHSKSLSLSNHYKVPKERGNSGNSAKLTAFKINNDRINFLASLQLIIDNLAEFNKSLNVLSRDVLEKYQEFCGIVIMKLQECKRVIEQYYETEKELYDLKSQYKCRLLLPKENKASEVVISSEVGHHATECIVLMKDSVDEECQKDVKPQKPRRWGFFKPKENDKGKHKHKPDEAKEEKGSLPASSGSRLTKSYSLISLVKRKCRKQSSVDVNSQKGASQNLDKLSDRFSSKRQDMSLESVSVYSGLSSHSSDTGIATSVLGRKKGLSDSRAKHSQTSDKSTKHRRCKRSLSVSDVGPFVQKNDKKKGQLARSSSILVLSGIAGVSELSSHSKGVSGKKLHQSKKCAKEVVKKRKEKGSPKTNRSNYHKKDYVDRGGGAECELLPDPGYSSFTLEGMYNRQVADLHHYTAPSSPLTARLRHNFSDTHSESVGVNSEITVTESDRSDELVAVSHMDLSSSGSIISVHDRGT